MKTPSLVFPMLALSLLLLTSCTNHEDLGPTPDGVLNIYGTVRSPDGPERGVVMRIVGMGSGLAMTIPTDDRGNYMLTVPAGRYRLSADLGYSDVIYYASSGLTYVPSEAEVIVASGKPGDMRVDFPLAALRLSIEMPPGLDDSYISCEAVDLRSGNAVSGRSSSSSDTLLVFEFNMLIPGRYILNLHYHYQQCWFPHTLDYRQAEPIDILPLQRVVRVDSLGTPGRVTGRVEGPWMQVAHYRPDIDLYGPDSIIVSSSEVAVDGSFDLPVLAEGEVRLQLDADAIETWLGGEDFSDADPIAVTSGSVVDVGAVQTHGITCRLVGEPGWEPTNWRATVAVGDRVFQVDPMETASEGLWVLRLKEAGAYALEVQWLVAADWRPQWFDRTTSLASASQISVDDAVAPTSIDIHLERGGTISGRVLDETGAPVVNARMAIRLGGTLTRLWRTGSAGDFLIGGLPDGPIRFAVLFEGTYIWYPGTTSEEEAEPIEILSAGDNAGLDLFLPGEGAAEFRYVGGSACKPCHTGELKGRIWETWLATAHARAYEDLDPGHRDSTECLVCHTTGFLGPIAPGRDRSNLLGVQCEACHGPGSEYKSLIVMKDPATAFQYGLITPNESACAPCHNSNLPQACWGADQQPPVFDYSQARAAIAHSRP